MRTAVKVITGAALLGIAVGGSMLDSANLFLPIVILAPCLVWLTLLVMANR